MTTFDHSTIANFESVTRLLGGWPSFDDFEVVSMLLERCAADEAPGLTVQFSGFGREVGPTDPNSNTCLITLRFGYVESLKLEGFNHQNAINRLKLSAKWSERMKREAFEVELIQGFGVGCTFECADIEVVSVTPARRQDNRLFRMLRQPSSGEAKE